MLRTYTRKIDQLVLLDALPQAGDTTPVVWLDLLKPTPAEDKSVEQQLGITIPSRDEMEEIELSSRLYNEDGAEFMTITILADIDTDEPIKTPVTFILKGQTLVTVRYAEPKPFIAYIARAQRPKSGACTSGEHVMLGIIEALIDRTADALEKIGNEIDSISRDVFRNTQAKANKKQRDLQSVVQRVGQKAELLTMIQESLVSISRLVTYHTALDTNASKVGREVRQLVKLIQRDAAIAGRPCPRV